MMQPRFADRRGLSRRWMSACALTVFALLVPTLGANAAETTWNDYLDHAYVYSAADTRDLQSLLDRTTVDVGRSLAEYHGETFPALAARAQPMTEAQIRRKAIAEFLLHRVGNPDHSLERSIETISALEDRLERHENRYWYQTIKAHQALESGDAEAFVDEVLTLWLEVITPLEVPFETYKTLALTENGNAGFVRTLPHLYESIARLVLVQSQTAALDGDIDSLGAIVRILTDERVGADPEAIAVDASSKALLDHIVARMDGRESDGGSLSYTLALVEAERSHQIARTRLADTGFTESTEAAIRDSVAAYQRAMRNANTLQGQVAIYTRALRQLGEVFAAGERLGEPIKTDVPFSITRAIELYSTLHAAKDDGWERQGYVDQSREDYLASMHGLWSEIQEASFNAASYYLTQKNAAGDMDDESIVHAINHYSRYLHAFESYEGDPSGESIPDSAYYGAYLAARGIGDGVLFFADGDASNDQLEEAISRYSDALAFFPFDRALWSTLAEALQRSGRESDFLAVAKPIAEGVVRSRHLDRWIQNGATWSTELASFRRAFENDRSLVYFGFADETKIDELESEFARLEAERQKVGQSIAATRIERDDLNQKRREAHRMAAELSGEAAADSPPIVASAPRGQDSLTLTQLGLDLERLSTSSERLDARIEAISQSLPIFKATLGHENLLFELSSQRDHPVHSLLRRYSEEYQPPTGEPSPEAAPKAPDVSWPALQSFTGSSKS